MYHLTDDKFLQQTFICKVELVEKLIKFRVPYDWYDFKIYLTQKLY